MVKGKCYHRNTRKGKLKKLKVLPQTSKSKEIKIKIKAIIRTPVSPKYILPKSRIDQDKSRENGRDMNPVKIKIDTHRK